MNPVNLACPFRFISLLSLLIGLASLGCSTMPQPPTLGLAPRTSVGGITEGLQIAPTRAVVNAAATGRTTVRGRLDGNGPHGGTALFEPRLAIHHAFAPVLQASAHMGWLQNGVDARLTPVPDSAIPISLSLGAQMNTLLARNLPFAWDVRALVSAEPRLGRRGRLLAGVGASYGRRRHAIYMEEGPLARYGVDQQVPVLLKLIRPEWRAEALLGIAGTFGSTALVVAAQPFAVVSHGNVTKMECNGCVSDLAVEDFEANWGVALTATFLFAGAQPGF